MSDNNKTQGIDARFPLHLNVLQQSHGRLGVAERLAFSHYVQLRRMNNDVTLFYEERISPEWRKGRENWPTGKVPAGIISVPRVSGSFESRNVVEEWVEH